MKVGLIGAGGIGSVHSQAYLQMPDVQVSAVLTLRAETAQKAASLHGAHAYTSLEEMLAHETLDMVDICTPTYTHASLAVQCLERKLPVLVEKPMALSLPDAQAMIDSSRRNGAMLMVAQVLRFWPEYAYLKRIHTESAYGQLLQAAFTRSSSAPMWSSQGWYVDPARSRFAPFEVHIHDLDFVLYLLGKPRQVRSILLERPERYVSFIRTQYLFDSSVLVEAEGGWYPGPLPFSHGFRAVFEKAILDFRSDELWLYEVGARDGRKVDVSSGAAMGPGLNLKDTAGFYNEIAYFVQCVRSGTPPTLITPEESYFSLQLLLTELESARIGKTLDI